jgi:glutamyl-tRNA synthetase
MASSARSSRTSRASWATSYFDVATGVFAYQLAVVVDDLAMCITDVVRGADLVASTPRQIWLAGVLGEQAPRYHHVPLVVAPSGARLEKRTPGSSVRALRDAGVAPERIVGVLAHGVGLAANPFPRSAGEVLHDHPDRPVVWRKETWPLPPPSAWVAAD